LILDLTFITPQGEPLIIRVIGREVYFAKNVQGMPNLSTIDGLNLNIKTIIDEFPDLADKPVNVIKAEAVKRFKEHVRGLKTADDVIEYLYDDLVGKHKYQLIMIVKDGFRPIALETWMKSRGQ